MSLTNREAFQKIIAVQNEEVDMKDSSVFQNDNSFKLKVMSSPAPYSGPATANQDPELLNQTGIDSKYLFTARILDPGMPHEKFLEDPCNESVSPNAAAGSRLYALHTKVRLSQAGEMPQFQPGDIIESEMLAGDLTNLYDLQFCDMIGVKDVFQNQQISKAAACAKLGNLFAGGDGSSGVGGAGFVGNVAGKPLTANDKLVQTTEEPPLITILRNKGYVVYEDGSINTIGVRSENRKADSFDDIIHLIWYKNATWNDIAFQITADPGTKVLTSLKGVYFMQQGTAQLKEGQYVDGWKFGMHGKRNATKTKPARPGYKALTQNGPGYKKITVYRDNNRNDILDWELSGGGTETGGFGINIHKAGPSSQQVSNWSAGCQVFQTHSDYAKAMGIWESTGQKTFTYTLLLWSDISSNTSNAVAYNEDTRGKSWEWVDESAGTWKYLDENSGDWITVTGEAQKTATQIKTYKIGY